MKTYAERKRKVEVVDQIVADPCDEDQVTLKYFPGFEPGGHRTEMSQMTVPNELLDRFCVAWLKDRAGKPGT